MNSSNAKHRHVCPLCEGMCGVEIGVEGNRAVSVRPDFNNVWSKGHMCPKGTRLADLHHDPDRLRTPMIREGSEWRVASWDEAFARCEQLLHGVLEKHGRDALGAYLGNMIAKCFGLTRYTGEFLRLAQIGKIFSSSTVDQHPKNLSCQLMYGDMWRVPIPDIDRTDLFVIFGGNPAVSQGSMFAHPDVMQGIADVRKRGGRVIVVDPVRTATAKKADQWIGIKPGADAAMLLAIVHTLFEEGRVRLGHLDGRVNGVDTVEQLAAQFSPERIADFCGVDAATIRQLARDIAAAPAAAVYGRIGLCTQEFGTLSSWLIDVVAILTGNLDKPGGTMWSREVAPHLQLAPPYPSDAPVITGYTRVRGVPLVLGQIPAGCFAEELDTPGAGQIRALVTIASNPVLSAPSAARIDAALADLECMICIDVYLNETTRHAHVILPTVSILEQASWDVWAWPFCLTSGGHYAPPLFSPPADFVADWEVALRLGALCSGKKNSEIDIAALDDEYFAAMCSHVGIEAPLASSHSPQRGPERILDLAIRSGPFGDRYGAVEGGLSLHAFKQTPDGILLGVAESRLDDILKTPSKKIELAPPHILQDIPRLEAAFARATPDVQLINRRQLSSMNSWMHNVDQLMRGRHRCTLFINPADAARFGLGEGDSAEVSSSENSVVVPVEITADISPGVVSLPHGWGHDAEGARMHVARAHAGINSNKLAPGDLLDVPSGNAVVNGIPVSIQRVAPAGLADAQAEAAATG